MHRVQMWSVTRDVRRQSVQDTIWTMVDVEISKTDDSIQKKLTGPHSAVESIQRWYVSLYTKILQKERGRSCRPRPLQLEVTSTCPQLQVEPTMCSDYGLWPDKDGDSAAAKVEADKPSGLES